jgi:hypothetical protein
MRVELAQFCAELRNFANKYKSVRKVKRIERKVKKIERLENVEYMNTYFKIVVFNEHNKIDCTQRILGVAHKLISCLSIRIQNLFIKVQELYNYELQ